MSPIPRAILAAIAFGVGGLFVLAEVSRSGSGLNGLVVLSVPIVAISLLLSVFAGSRRAGLAGLSGVVLMWAGFVVVAIVTRIATDVICAQGGTCVVVLILRSRWRGCEQRGTSRVPGRLSLERKAGVEEGGFIVEPSGQHDVLRQLDAGLGFHEAGGEDQGGVAGEVRHADAVG